MTPNQKTIGTFECTFEAFIDHLPWIENGAQVGMKAMSPHLLQFDISDALGKEMRVSDGWYRECAIEKELSKIARPEDYFGPLLEEANFSEVAAFIMAEPAGLKVLDIGVGRGQSTLFIAAHGHHVTAVEPSEMACCDLEKIAKHLKLSLEVYQGIAEVVDQLPENSFDLVIFNSSLHHCDDPVRALKNCYRVLKPSGRVALLNEPLLKPFRSKSWYYRRLETHPMEMGHYGGNEHVYYAWEYKRMLRTAGFRDTKIERSHHITDLRKWVQQMVKAQVGGGFVYSEFKLLLHFAWHFALSRLSRISPLKRMLQTLSLLPVSFQAWKRSPLEVS